MEGADPSVTEHAGTVGNIVAGSDWYRGKQFNRSTEYQAVGIEDNGPHEGSQQARCVTIFQDV